MSVVVGREERGSSWQDESRAGSPAENRMFPMEVSLREQQLLLRLRMLEAGEFSVRVKKTRRGMWGLVESRVVE